MEISPISPALAEAAVDEFLENDKWRKKISEYGWGLERLAPLTLVAKLPAGSSDAEATTFTLRVTCDYYPAHPPDVRFVNPETLEYDPTKDLRHVANLQASWCYVHPTFGYPKPFPYGPQLVCSSHVLGYYVSGHAPTPAQMWDPDRHTIGTSLYAVHSALRSPHYHGRHA